jgi:hypothetical protein
MQDLEEFYQDRIWLGLDKYRPPQDLDPGFVTQADNLYNVGGELMIRPGKQAQLSSAMGAPVYVIGTFLDSEGTGAAATATVSMGAITGFSVSPGGSGYNSPPAVIITDSTGTGATATATVSGGAVTGITPGHGGMNYASPTISFGPPPVWILFVCNGKLYKIQNGTSTPTEIKDNSGHSLSLNGPGVQMARYGEFGYLIDGTATGPLYQIDLTQATAVTALNAPGSAPIASLANANVLLSFDPKSAAYDAPPAYDPLGTYPTQNAFPTSYKAVSGHVWAATAGWTPTNLPVFGSAAGVTSGSIQGSMRSLLLPAPAFYDNYNGIALEWVSFYDPSSNLESPSITNIQHGDGSGEYASQFLVSFYYYQCNINAAVNVTCKATNTAGTFQKTYTVHPQSGTPNNIVAFPAISLLFDFSELASVADPITSWKVVFQGAPTTNAALANLQGMMIAFVTGGPIWGVLGGAGSGNYDSGSWFTTRTKLQNNASIGWIADSQAEQTNALPPASFNNFTKDARLTVSFGSGASFTPTVSGGAVTGIDPGHPFTGGSGYLQGTVINFTGGGGSGASALAAVNSSGVITGIQAGTLVGGIGYTSAPTPIFGQPLSDIEYVSVPLKGFIESGTLQFNFPSDSIELRLLPAGSGQNYVPVSMTLDPSGNFATADLTSLLPADVACVASAQIHFIDNPVVSATAFNFNVGQLTIAGNLSVGFAPYNWIYTEVDSNGDTTLARIIESDPTPYSNTLAPTGQTATAQLALPTGPINGSSDKFFLYRSGGTFSDGLMRLVTAASWSEVFNMAAQPKTPPPTGQPPGGDTPPGVQLTPYNKFVSWGQVTPQNTNQKIFVDNTPDANLVGNPVLVPGKQPAPKGATAIARFQNRLWLAVPNGVISSWLLSTGDGLGLYFNPTVDPTDPNASLKGSGFIPVGQGDNDAVVSLKALGTVLTVWKGLSCYYIDGYDPTNFGCNEYQAIQDQGLVAPKGIVVADNVIYLLQQDGVYTFDGSQLNKISDPISPYLTPVLNENGGVIAAPAYANCACVFHGGRLFVFAPDVNGSLNSVAHVWDTRFPGWVGRWTGMNVTSGVSIGNNTDGPDLWLGGLDGQLYRMTGNGDTATFNGTVSPVSFTLATRAFGRPPSGLTIWMQGRYNLPLGVEDRAWEPFFRKFRVTRLWLEVDTGSGSPLSLTAGAQYGDQSTAVTYPLTITGHQRVSLRTKPDRGGLGVTVSLTGSTSTSLKVIAAGATISRGAKVG